MIIAITNNFSRHLSRMAGKTDYSDPIVRCFCGTVHVEKITYVLSIVFALLSALRVVLSIVGGNIYGSVSNGIEVLVFVLNIVALKNRNPNLYLPSMIFLIINIVCAAIAMIFLSIMLCVQPEWYVNMIKDEIQKSEPELAPAYTDKNSRAITGIILFVLGWSLAISTFTYAMIYRAYVYMKLDAKEKNHLQK